MNCRRQESIFTNNTDFYILVGNYEDIISLHKTFGNATIALRSIDVSDSNWTSIWILKPGETLPNNYIKGIYVGHRDAGSVTKF